MLLENEGFPGRAAWISYPDLKPDSISVFCTSCFLLHLCDFSCMEVCSTWGSASLSLWRSKLLNFLLVVVQAWILRFSVKPEVVLHVMGTKKKKKNFCDSTHFLFYFSRFLSPHRKFATNITCFWGIQNMSLKIWGY